MKAKIITCAGYYGTGSSAITDLLSEFDNIYSLGDYEFRFVQDPEGISDLEYNLVENNHRHNSGHALKRFRKKVDFLSGSKLIKRYEPFFNGKFREISHEYIDALTDLSFEGYWHQDVIDRGICFWFIERSLEKIYNKMLQYAHLKNATNDCMSLHLLKNEKTLISVPGNKFYELTRDYLDRLFSAANLANKEYIMVDQLLPPTNTQRYLRYFNDIKLISVDRDPRDIYLLEKYYWKGGVVPKNIDQFCQWFTLSRSHLQSDIDDPTKVFRIMFEDLVYNYDETKKNILRFLGIDERHHLNKKLNFNPNISISNIGLWKQHPQYQNEAEYIKHKLDSFCYKNEYN